MGEVLIVRKGGKKSGAYVWKKLTAKGGNFVEFVVSDQSTSYPDGGTQDGYWYEKVVEGIAFENISRFNKVAVDTFVFASDQGLDSGITLAHSLGVKPAVILLFSKTKPDIRNCIVEMLQSAVGTYAYEELNRVTTHVSTGAFMLETTQISASTTWLPTSSLVKLPKESSLFLGAGLEYTLITMA